MCMDLSASPHPRAVLLALLRTRPEGLRWSEIAAEVALKGDASAVWDEYCDDGALVPDPERVSAIADATRELAEWESAGLRVLSVLDDDYPARLRDIREMPPFLFVSGSLLADDRGMSVVGSRRCSAQGLSIARAAAEELVSRGLTVISGLAAGIDAEAHRTALDLGGRTVAFIGTGIRKYYPASNRQLQVEIARHGLVASQFFPDAPPTRHNFPMRNAVMSGYGLATIVVEASETSGTRIQARLAVAHGRPVILSEQVVTNTEWGAALAARPGVRVVAARSELADAIDEVSQQESKVEQALSAQYSTRVSLIAS